MTSPAEQGPEPSCSPELFCCAWGTSGGLVPVLGGTVSMDRAASCASLEELLSGGDTRQVTEDGAHFCAGNCAELLCQLLPLSVPGWERRAVPSLCSP